MEDPVLAEARALGTALLVARLARITFERGGPRVPLAFGNHLHSASARLLLVPAVEPVDTQALGAGMQAAAADALVVRVDADGMAVFDAGLLVGGFPEWFTGLRLHVGAELEVHVVAEPGIVVALSRYGLARLWQAPWHDAAARRQGFVRAAALLAFAHGAER